ncbi:hypothetical protein PSPO01_05233 [Paraphaeosphaeria sporulosa]
MSTRRTFSLSPRRSSYPSYMQPTQASEARAQSVVSLKRSSSTPASIEVTPGSIVLAQASTVTIAVAEGPQVQQEVVVETLQSSKLSNNYNSKDTSHESTAQVTEKSTVQLTEDVVPIAPIGPMARFGSKLSATPIAPTIEVLPSSLSSSNSSNSTQATDPTQIPVPRATGQAVNTMPKSVKVTKEVSKKRKRLEGVVKKSSKIPNTIEPTVDDADKNDTDKELVTKKRKTRSQAPSPDELLELDADGDDEDDVIVPQRKRKATTVAKARASKAVVEKPVSSTKSLDPEINRMIKAEEKRKAAAASGNVFARNPKLRRSLADVTAASARSRPILGRPTKVEMVAAPKSAKKIVAVPLMKDSSSARIKEGAVTHDGDVTIADLRSIKYLNVTANIRMVHIDRIVQCPLNYPNIHIETDESERPVKAYITKMTDNEFKLAFEAAIGRDKEKRKLDAKLERQNKGKAAGSKTAQASSVRKVVAGKATASKVPIATSATKKGTATKITPGIGTEKSPLSKVLRGRITRQPPKSGPRSS